MNAIYVRLERLPYDVDGTRELLAVALQMNAAAADGVQGQIADCGLWRSFLCRLSEDGRPRRRGGQRRGGCIVAGAQAL